jgi:quinoprotein glucose dehydrogenase
MQYSSLSQITTDNVHTLKEAWRFRTGELGQGHREPFAFQANPILVEGRLYLPTGSAIVFALDPASGEEIWRYDPKIDRSKPHAEIANRGVTSWLDPAADADDACRHRIFVGTLDARLIAIDGTTGKPCEDFGEGGEIWLNKGVRAEKESAWVNYTVTSPPVIVGDIVIPGAGACLRAYRVGKPGFLWRRAGRRQSLCELARGSAREYRQDRVVPAARSP